MLEIRVNIHCPDLVTAAGMLAGVIQKLDPAAKQPAPLPETPQDRAPNQVQQPVPQPQAPPVQVPTAPPQTESAPSPAPAVPPVVPTEGPTYTNWDVSRAGADLIRDNPGIQPQIVALKEQFGVGSAMELTPEQLGPFAAALRQLGAKL